MSNLPINSIALILFFLGFYSCQKAPLPSTTPTIVETDDDPPFPKLLHLTTATQGGEAGSEGVLFSYPLAFYSIDYTNNENDFQLEAFDVETMAVRWTWNDWLEEISRRVWTICVIEGKVIFSEGKHLYCLDFETGEPLWVRPNLGGNQVKAGPDYVWVSNREDKIRSNILRIDPNDGSETVFQTFNYAIDNWGDPRMDFVQTLENGHQALFYQDRRVQDASVYGYDLTTDELLFSIDTLFENQVTNSFGPWYYQGNVYMMDNINLYCLDGLTGAIRWRQEYDFFDAGMVTTYPYFSDGKIFMHFSGSYKMLALDAQTGKEIWVNWGIDGNTSAIVEIDGRLYFTSWADSQLYCIDKNSGAVIWTAESPNEELLNDGIHFYDAQPAVYAAGKLLFLTDFVSFMVYQVEE